jgi:hypothetical protein
VRHYTSGSDEIIAVDVDGDISSDFEIVLQGFSGSLGSVDFIF